MYRRPPFKVGFHAIWALFSLFISGAASLTLETLWFEWLALHWGRTAEASAAVLACFMLGLGIGQWLMAHSRQLPISAIKLWAACEAAVGLLALLSNWRFSNTTDIVGASALLWMLLPTVVMGMTLPLAVSVLRQQQLGSRIGLAYAANTLGAALGCLLTAWWLTRELGLTATGHAAVVGQLLAAILVFTLRPKPATATPLEQPKEQKNSWPALIAVACSGLFVLGMEILWFRTLLLSHRSTNENFAVMLAAVLIGLALGSSLAAASQRRWPNLRTATVIAGLLLAQCVVSVVSFTLWQPGTGSLLLDSLWLIAPSCLCSGALMVFAAQALNPGNARSNSARLILASTLGSTIGAPLVALVLLPAVGVAVSLQLLLAVALLAALFNERHIALFGAIVVLIMAWPLADHWQQKQTRAAQLYVQLDQAQILQQADGKYQTVQLLESTFLGKPLSHRLMTDSYSMTSTAADSERYMRLFAWLPQAMNTTLEDALLISYGVGSTAEAILDNPATKTLTVADPSSTILETSRLIPRRRQPLDDPRTTVMLNDGRQVLNESPELFDLVTGEPPPPRLAGMHALYSQEYFELMQQALKPGGWASYWLPVDQLSVTSSKAIIAGFCVAFADCSLWAGSHYNWILLGSNRGTAEGIAISQLFEQARHLQDSGLEAPEQLASTFIAGPHSLREWVGDQAPLTDNWPQRIDQHWPNEQDIETYAAWLDGSEIRFSHSLYFQLWQLSADKLDIAWALQPLMNGQFRPSPEQRLNVVDQLLTLSHWQAPILWALGTDHKRSRIADASSGKTAQLHQAVTLLAQRSPLAAQKLKALANDFPLAADLAALAKKL